MDLNELQNEYSMNNSKLIPKLRFPEFQNSGEWEEKRLGQMLTESKIPITDSNPQKRITVRLNLKGVEKREFKGTEAENATYFFVRSSGQFIYGKQNIHKGAFGIIPEELDGYESSQDIPASILIKDFILYFSFTFFQEKVIIHHLKN